MSDDILLTRTKALKLYGLINHWDEVVHTDWISKLIDWEEKEKSERSLARRLAAAHLKRFKPLAEFDWAWPKTCDKSAIESWMTLDFINKSNNLILCGPNGVGKSTIACNVAYQTVIQGHTALFTTAADMLNELAAIDSDSALRRRIKYYTNPHFLVIDEIGYLSYGNRHADLLFEIISRRYEAHPTMITTNKPFNEWNDIFPNAACVVSIIDRLIHHSDVVNIDAESYRLKEAKEQAANKAKSNTKKEKT